MKKIIVLFYNFLWGNEPIFPDSLPPEGLICSKAWMKRK